MGIHDETLVIYMGDNGFMFGEHGLIDKRVAYETSIRVPLLMQCPELLQQRVVDDMVANIDVAPVILEAMGLPKPDSMDGQSFLSLAQGKASTWRDYFLYVYYWEKNFPQSLSLSLSLLSLSLFEAINSNTQPITGSGTPMNFLIFRPIPWSETI